MSLSYDFKVTTGSTVSFGNNSDILLTRERILTVTQLNENGIPVWYKVLPNGKTNTFGYDLEVTETNQAIRIIDAGNTLDEYDRVRVIRRHNLFKQDARYEVFGTFGWSTIPEDVLFCVRLLVKDYFCRDTAWRVKYVEMIKASDWSITFNAGRHLKTGNIVVDQILSLYSPNQLVMI